MVHLLYCPRCNRNIDDATDEFCPDCGTQLVQNRPSASATIVAGIAATASGILGSIRSWLVRLSPRGKIVLALVILAIIIIGALSIHAGSSSVQFTRLAQWQDPKEGAFTFLAPQGWTVTGGVVRQSVLSRDFSLTFNVVDSAGTMGIFFAVPSFPLFLVPDQQMAVLCGTADGTVCNLDQVSGVDLSQYGISGGILGSFTINHYMTVDEYAHGTLWTQLKTLGAVKSDSPDPTVSVQADSKQWFAQMIDNTQYQGAVVTLQYSSSGSNVKLVSNLGLNKDCLAVLGFNFGCNWQAAFSGFWGKSDGDFNTAADIYQLVVMPTFRINPQWYLTLVQNAGVQSQMIAHHTQVMQELPLLILLRFPLM